MRKFEIDDELLKRQRKRQRLRKLKKEQRKIRKNKLIKLGTLFLVAELLEESQDTMLGFLQDFQPKDEYLEEGEKFLKRSEERRVGKEC